MNKFLLAAGASVTLLLLAGCNTIPQIGMKADNAQKLQGHTATYAVYEKQKFEALTPGAAVGFVGENAIANGRSLLKKYDLRDPAIYISQALMKFMSLHYGVKPVPNDDRVASDTDIETVASTYKNADYIVDVKTYRWGFAYFPLDWGVYRSMYGARLRVIRTADQAIVAEDSCKYNTPYSRAAPDYDEMLADNASKLHEMFHAQAKKCVSKFETKVLNAEKTQNRSEE